MSVSKLLSFVAGAVLLGALPLQAADQGADLVVLNAKVLTVDPKFSKAEAVAIRDGVFVAVGSNADVKTLVDDKTRVIDAGGKTVLPGLIESHIHAIGASRGEAAQPFIQLGSIGELQDWIRKQAESKPEGTWILIPRIDMTRLRERRFPTRAELDVAPRHPVMFNWQYASRQLQVLNTAGLKAAQITRDTPVPAGAKILKDASGEPTGQMENMRNVVAKLVVTPPISDEQYLDSLEQLLRRYNESGITSVMERNTNAAGYRAYEALEKAGRLTVRANVTIGIGSDGTPEGSEKAIKALPFQFASGSDWVRVGPLKIGVDGGILYGTAYLRDPYGPQSFSLYGLSDPEYRGTLNMTPEKITNIIRAGHKLGWQMCSHVTGDAGVDVVLDAVEAVNREQSIKDKRYTLIHAYFPTDSAIRRCVELGVCVDTQPAWYYKDGDALVDALGAHRLKNFIGLADWLKGGVKTAINSDHMQGFDPNKSLNPYNPFLTMYTAVSRKTESGLVVAPEQKVSREDALRMMTVNAAYLSFDETRKGSIEVGKLGDLTILAEDFLTCDDEHLRDMKVLQTIVGGKVVYDAVR